MTSIYALIGSIAVFVSCNYAAFDAMTIMASKGCVPYSAIKTSKSIKRSTVSSVSLDSCDVEIDDKRTFIPCYEKSLDKPLLSPRGMYQGIVEKNDLANSLRESGAPDILHASHVDALKIEGINKADERIPSFLNRRAVAEGLRDATTILSEGSLGESTNSAYSVVSSAVIVSSISSTRQSFQRTQSMANFSDIADLDEELEVVSNPFSPALVRRESLPLFDGLVSDDDSSGDDSNGLSCLAGEFKETVISDSDSDDNVFNVFSLPPPANQRHIPQLEKMTVTFARTNRRETINRGNRFANRAPSVPNINLEISVRAIVKPAPLTPINRVLRCLQPAESRSADDRLREAGNNCLLPVRFEFNPLIKAEVVKLCFNSRQSGENKVET